MISYLLQDHSLSARAYTKFYLDMYTNGFEYFLKLELDVVIFVDRIIL
jgi:hypothetical protein